jgi:hypothetical protein
VWTYGYLLRRVYEVAEECGVKSDISLLAGGGEVARSKLEMAVLESHIQRKLGRF